jgi:hypothetical protein
MAADSEAVSTVLPDIDPLMKEGGKDEQLIVTAEGRAVSHLIAVCAACCRCRRQAREKGLGERKVSHVVDRASAQTSTGEGFPTVARSQYGNGIV